MLERVVHIYVLRFMGFFLSFFLLAQQPAVGQGLLIQKVSISHTTTEHSR
jgi:hypothetical protein